MSMQLPVVVIDPGHGGNANTGGSSSNNATGPNGLLEKNLTLDVGRRLAAALAGRARVVMTRTGDTNLSLAARARVARDNGARLFLSIHFNGFRDPSVDGTEVWVARRAGRASRDFARTLLARLVAATGVADRGVRERDLGVLLPARHLPETAACLAEIAFLTNQAQARRLEDPAYLQRIAEALAEGVVRQLPAPAPAAAHSIAASSLAAAIGGFGSRVADYAPAATGYGLGLGGQPAASALAREGTAARLEFIDLNLLQGGDGAQHLYYLTKGGRGGRWGDSAIFRLKITNTNDVKNFKDCVLKVRLQAHQGDDRWKTIPLEGQKEGEEYKQVSIPDIEDESSHTSAVTVRRAALDKAYDAMSKDSPRARLEVILRWRESGVFSDDNYEKKHGVTFYLVRPAEIMEGRKRLLETLTLSDEKYREWWLHVGGKQFTRQDQTPIEIVRTIQVTDSESQTGEETRGRSRTDTRGEESGTETSVKVNGEFGKKDVWKVAGEFQQKWSSKVTRSVSDQLTESVRTSWTYVRGEARSTSVKSTVVPGTPDRGQTAYLKRKDIYLIPTVEFYEVPVIRYDGPNDLGQATARREEATILPRVVRYAYVQVESNPAQQGQTQIPAGSGTPPRPTDDETSLRRNFPPARGHALSDEDEGAQGATSYGSHDGYEPAAVRPAGEDAYAEPLARPRLTERDARVAADADSPDYRHLGEAINTTPFTLNAQTVERLCRLNSFNANSGADGRTGRDEVLFGLRGCVLAEGRTGTGGLVNSVSLVEAAFDHRQSRCVLGVWKRSTGQVAAFLGSTVPFWRSMENYRQGGDACNMLLTGRYVHTVGVHHPNHRLEIKGALLQNGPVVVVRTLDDLIYETTDRFENGNVGDNIHPSRHTAPTDPFSSEGCSTVPGTYDLRTERHAGLWTEFRAAAGLTPNSAPAAENGRRFVFVLLTGREARLAASGAGAAALTRLRFGSNGVDVQAIQQGLRRSGHYTGIDDGQMGTGTVMAYIAWQKAQNRAAPTADGIVTPAAGRLLNADIVNHASVPS